MEFHSVQGSWWWEFWRISLPFFIGYLTAGWAAEAYDLCSRATEYRRRGMVGLVVGFACSIFLRCMQRAEWPIPSFVIASGVFFAVCSLLGRTLYWKLRGRRAAQALALTE